MFIVSRRFTRRKTAAQVKLKRRSLEQGARDYLIALNFRLRSSLGSSVTLPSAEAVTIHTGA